MEPTPAERARTLLALHPRGVLATLDADFRPYVAPVDFVADGAGNPVMVLSRLDPHTSRAFREPRAGMVVDRVSLQGDLVPVPGIQQLDLQPRYLDVHPQSWDHVESLAWAWFRLEVTHARLADDRTERWLEVDDLAAAEPDPVAPAEPWLLDELQASLGDALVGLVTSVGGRLHARSARLVSLDRYGLVVDVDDPSQPQARRARVAFPDRLDHPDQVHSTVAFMVRTLRARLSG